jgi:hypothetical protein
LPKFTYSSILEQDTARLSKALEEMAKISICESWFFRVQDIRCFNDVLVVHLTEVALVSPKPFLENVSGINLWDTAGEVLEALSERVRQLGCEQNHKRDCLHLIVLYPVKVFLVREWRVKNDAVVEVKLVAWHDVVNRVYSDEHDVQVFILSSEKPKARSCKVNCAEGELLQLRHEMADLFSEFFEQMSFVIVSKTPT